MDRPDSPVMDVHFSFPDGPMVYPINYFRTGPVERAAMTSGGLEPVVDTGRGNHSVFANIFLKTLRENTEIIDTDSLFETIRRGVVLNARQTPKYEDIKFCGHDDGDFIWIPR